MTLQEIIDKYEKLADNIDKSYPDTELLVSKAYRRVCCDLRKLQDEYAVLEKRYERLKTAVNESMITAHITDTRIKRVQSNGDK